MPEDSGDRRPFDPLVVIAGPAGLGHGWLQVAPGGSMPQMPGTLGASATGHGNASFCSDASCGTADTPFATVSVVHAGKIRAIHTLTERHSLKAAPRSCKSTGLSYRRRRPE